MATTYRVQYALLGDSTSSKDFYVNTWHINSEHGDVNDSQGADILNAFYEEFYRPLCEVWYTTTHEPGSVFKIYRLGDAPHSPPRYQYTWPSNPLTAFSSAARLPSEIASCLSMEGVIGGTGVRARRRGRVYLGPLTMSAAESVGGYLRPSAGFRGDCCAKFETLADGLTAVEWQLGIYSKRDATFVPAEHCWMDDAFDVVRGRGIAPTTRSTNSLS